MLKAVSVLIASLVALPLSAQPLHGHPQLAAYTDPSQYPTVSSQCHWAPGENPIAAEDGQPIALNLAMGMLGTSTLAHTHLDLVKCPIYSEITGPITCQFAVKLFHTTGTVSMIAEYQEGIRNIVWDATGSSVAPSMVGDPAGLAQFTGHLTLDPSLPTRWSTPHGWWSPVLNVQTFYANGDGVNNELLATFYSMLDPTVPVSGGYYDVGAHCSPGSFRHPGDKWGDNYVDTGLQFLPLTPIDKPYPIIVGTAGYGGQLFNAVFEQRADLDLHNHNGGTLLKTITQTGNINATVVLDPAVLGTGPHKMALLRNQLSSEGNDAVNTLLVFDVTVGPAFPVPTICQDPTATNFGGPLPCTFPPVIVPDVWTTILTLGGLLDVQKFGATENFRVCVATKCTTEFPIIR